MFVWYCLQRGCMRLLARVAHACIEGSIFIYTSPGQSRLAQLRLHVAPALYAASKQPSGFSTTCIDAPSKGDSSTCTWTAGYSLHDLKGLVLQWYRLSNILCGPKCCATLVCGTKAVSADSMQSCVCLLVGKGTACAGKQWSGKRH